MSSRPECPDCGKRSCYGKLDGSGCGQGSIEPRTAESFREPDPDAPQIGAWFWVNEKGQFSDETAITQDANAPSDSDVWLGCVIDIGSNYAELRGIETNRSYPCRRIQLRDFDKHCRRCEEPERLIASMIQKLQARVASLMDAVREVTAKLAITPAPQLNGNSSALALHDRGEALGDYKAALIEAQKTTLPNLFKEIENTNKELAGWMQASLIPLEAQAEGMKESLAQIQARIFNVELYAGLVEKVEQIRDGKPAALSTPVHLFQRRHYMDEECLANYEAGGMEFKDLRKFDRWIAKRENMERILPHPRSIVAFQVRRNMKERQASNLREFIRFLFEGDADKLTFLYIRNGDQLYRLSTEIDFGARLFPDMENSQLTGKLYARMFANSCDALITEGAWLEMRKQEEAESARNQAAYEKAKKEYPTKLKEYKAAHAAWKAAPVGDRGPEPYKPSEPWYHESSFRESDRYEPFEPDNIHYDDIRKFLQKQMDEHNRLVLVLQGLLDRSPVLHPHPPWRLFEPEGFAAALVLVYDDARALVSGAAPDFEAYRARLNSSLRAGCVTVGQETAWLRQSAEKENARRDRDWRRSNDFELQEFWPYGNPGPGKIAKVVRVGRDGLCHFTWMRQRQSFGHGNGKIQTHCAVPAAQLLNVSAYRPGDFKQFYADPRTRADYLKWSPLLLAAEDYWATKGGNS